MFRGTFIDDLDPCGCVPCLLRRYLPTLNFALSLLTNFVNPTCIGANVRHLGDFRYKQAQVQSIIRACYFRSRCAKKKAISLSLLEETASS